MCYLQHEDQTVFMIEIKAKFLFILISICAYSQISIAQSKTFEWFPDESKFPLLEYELLETKPYLGIFIIKTDSIRPEGVYIPVNIGFRKPVFSWSIGDAELNGIVGIASYTQFNLERFDANTLRGGLLNIDYKVNGILSALKGRHNLRFQIFHISSHLGDDYIIRNQHFEYNDKSVNYEQIDLTYLYAFDQLDIYFGIGEVYSKYAYRERFMIQSGFQGNIPISQNLDLSFGSDIKVYEENDFSPDIHYGFGITVAKEEQRQFNMMIDGYFGRLPYSTLEWGKIRWIGLSFSIYL